MRRLGVGSWHSRDFRLPDDVHYPARQRGGRVFIVHDGVLVTGNEIEPRPDDHLARIIDDMRAGADD